jgi:hypothetical protein
MPTAVESIANLGAVLVPLPAVATHTINLAPSEPNLIGGRSSVGSAVFSVPAGHASGKKAPVTEDPANELRPLLPSISSALRTTLSGNPKTLDILGVGTDNQVINALIGLLKTQGFHATISYCDGSVRSGFSGPTAVLRAHGGVVPVLFLQQVGSALTTH